jgi:hypothetical protein
MLLSSIRSSLKIAQLNPRIGLSVGALMSSAATIPAMTIDKQTESQPVRQSNDAKPQRTMSDSDIHELISFFRLLDEWDREAKADPPDSRSRDRSG